MYEKEACVEQYRQILRLLEEDACTIEHSLKGEVLIAYRKLLNQEMDLLRDALKSLQTNNFL